MASSAAVQYGRRGLQGEVLHAVRDPGLEGPTTNICQKKRTVTASRFAEKVDKATLVMHDAIIEAKHPKIDCSLILKPKTVFKAQFQFLRGAHWS